MNANDVLAMYENLAGLSGQMAQAAESGNWSDFEQLNLEARVEARPAVGAVPALDGARRQRKIDLLKQLMANDRAIRDITDPWGGQVERALHAH